MPKLDASTQTPRRLFPKEPNQMLRELNAKLVRLEELLVRRFTKQEPNQIQLPINEPKLNTYENCTIINNKVQIGPNGTLLSKNDYSRIDWTNCKKATRDLCYMIFGQDTLATHTLTGRVGPYAVVHNKKTKAQLDPLYVADIKDHIMRIFGVKEAQVLAGIRLACRNSIRALKVKKDN